MDKIPMCPNYGNTEFAILAFPNIKGNIVVVDLNVANVQLDILKGAKKVGLP